MEDKYYIPTMEEFHVGFEYEEFVKGEGWSHREVLFIGENITLNKNNFCIDFPDDFRVKYLDEEDLKSLGFVEINNNQYILDNKRAWIHLNITKFSSWINLKIEASVYSDSIRTLVVHSIRIKNKSELKKLMQQLNIL